MLREVHVLGKLSHPNIVTLYDVGQIDEYVYIAMEYIDGGTLATRQNSGRVDQRAVLEILSAVASALDYAHGRGIIHRDIKPSNIMVTREGTVKVVDFGIARVVDAARSSQYETQEPVILGSLGFFSPEQLRAPAGEEISVATDQFSLGVVAYQLLTGRMPFEGDSVAATISNVLHQDPTPAHLVNPTLDAAVDAVLNKALDKQADQRYASCSDFVARLLEACARRPGWAPSRPEPEAAGKRASAGTAVPYASPPNTRSNETRPGRPGEFTMMFENLAASGVLARAATAEIPTIFPEPKTTFFRAQNERFQKIEESIKFYRENLTTEYQNLTRQADLTYKLWLGCVGVGFALLAAGVTLMFVGSVAKGALTASSTVLVYFIQRVFHQREDYYRDSADSKSKHLQYGNQWLLVIQSVDAIEDAPERVKRQTALVDVLTDRLRVEKSLAPRPTKRST
ncbi:MAG: serine/threonine protein kinase [Candidatus Sulfotelmatobacter sp.]